MLIKKTSAKTYVAAIALCASSTLFAYDYNGLYIVGGAGYGVIEDGQFASNSEPWNLKSNSSLVWRAGVGTWFTDTIGLEFNWHGMRGMDDNASINFEGNEYTSKLKVSKQNFFDLSAIGRCFLSEKFSVFGRLGPAYAETKREVKIYENGAYINNSRQENGGIGAALGVGAQYDFTPAIGLRLDATTIQATNNNDLYAVTGNIVVNFGGLM